MKHRPAMSPLLFGVLGVVLLVAGGLKTRDLVESPEDRSFWAVLGILPEWLLAFWFFSGKAPRTARATALATFSLFLGVAFTRAVSGQSCGCFGRANVPTWLVMAFDLSAVAALASVRIRRLRPWTTSITAALALALLSTGMWRSLELHAAPKLDGTAAISATQRLVALEPATWEGKSLPILEFIHPNEPLRKGEWLVFLFQMHCRHCQMAMPFFLEAAEKLQARGSPRRVAFIEMPPQVATAEDIDPKSPVARMVLSDDHEWSVRTPLVLLLKDGVVISVPESPDDVPADWGGYPPTP